MFQKLYKHLEVMSDSLRQQESHNTRYETAAQKIAKQLELVNDALLSQNQLLASQGSLSREALSQSRRGLTPVLQLINLVLCCIGLVAITYFSASTFRLSRITEKVVNSTAPSLQPAHASSYGRDAGQDTLAASRTDGLSGEFSGLSQQANSSDLSSQDYSPSGLAKRSNERQIGGSNERQIAVEQHLAKLDSLISEQAQSIKELKKLNTTAVRTFNHIKRHFDLTDTASAAFTRR